MNGYIRWFGAALILLAGGGYGYITARQYRTEEKALEELRQTLMFLSSELECRLTPLPQLFSEAAKQGKGVISKVLLRMQQALDEQLLPDAEICMQQAIQNTPALPERTKDRLLYLSRQLGKFDLNGQLAGLDAVRQMCERDLAGLRSEREARLRSNQVLGLCAGAALVIILI